MSELEQDLADQEIQRIFLNPNEEATAEETTDAVNRPSAPVPFEDTCALSSSDSEQLDASLADIFRPTPINVTQSEGELDSAEPKPSGSGNVALTRSTPISDDGEIVSAVALMSPIKQLLVTGIYYFVSYVLDYFNWILFFYARWDRTKS